MTLIVHKDYEGQKEYNDGKGQNDHEGSSALRNILP